MLPRRPWLSVAVAVVALLLAVTAVTVGVAGLPTDAQESASPDERDASGLNANSTNVSVANATVWTGSESVRDNLTSAGAVRERQRSGALIRDATVATSDPFVLELRMPGFSERLAATEGPNTTVRFFRATHGPNSGIRFESRASPEFPEVALGMNRTAATTVFADRANETYYLTVDPPAMRFGTRDYGGTGVNWSASVADEPSWLVDNLPFGLNVTIDGSTWTFDGSGRWSELDPIVLFDDPDAYLNGGNQDVISASRDESVQFDGNTNLAPGTELTLRLTNRSDGGSPRVTTATVFGDGSNVSESPYHLMSGSLSTMSLEPNSTFDIEVVRNGSILYSARGVVNGSADSAPGTGTNATVTNVSVWTAPQGADDRLTNLTAVRAAERSGSLTRARSHGQNRARTLVWNDTLVLKLRAPGLAERMAAVGGPNETIRFFRATYGEHSSIALWQTFSYSESQPLAGRLNRTAATTVVADHPNNTYYLVVDPTAVRFGFCEWRCGDGYDWSLEGFDRFDAPRYGSDTDRLRYRPKFAVNVRIDGESTTFTTDEHGSPVPIVGFQEPRVRVGNRSDEPVELFKVADAPVRARTNLAPGTTVVVRLTDRSDGGRTRVDRATVRKNESIGIVSADFDTSSLSIGTTFMLEFAANGYVLAEAEGVVQSGTPSTPTATPSPTPSPTPTPTVTPTPTATVSPTASPTQTATPTPTTGARTPTPTTGAQTPTSAPGTNASATPTPSPDSGGSAAMPGTAATPPPTDATTTDSSGGSGPGLGPVVTVAALLAAALLARLRRA